MWMIKPRFYFSSDYSINETSFTLFSHPHFFT